MKVGVASSIAALLARWNTFRRVLSPNNAIRPETEADAVYDAAADRGRDASAGLSRPTVSPIFLSKAHS